MALDGYYQKICFDVRKYEKEQSLLIIDSGVSRWFDAICKVDNGLRQDNR
jgi:hypothetical protein